METGDEIQLRGAVSDASKADVPVEEVEEAQKFLQRLTLRRRVDFLEKAIGSRDEGQLREAIAAARKVSLPEKNGSEVARANSILGRWGRTTLAFVGCVEAPSNKPCLPGASVRVETDLCAAKDKRRPL